VADMPVTGSAIRRWVSFTIRRGRSDAFEAILSILSMSFYALEDSCWIGSR